MQEDPEDTHEKHSEHGFHKVIQGVDVDLSYASLAFPFVIALAAILLTLIVFLRKKKSRNTVLILGLSDSGKTFIFSKFLGQGCEWECYKSMTENKATIDDAANKPIELVDFPGAERLRSLLFETWLGRNVDQIRRILFLVDSNTFTKKARDIAEFLHDVLFAAGEQIPIMICCNKQDLDTAKSSKAIKALLEKELGLVCQTRNRTLESTTLTAVRSLCPEGDFSWSKLSGEVEFKDISAVNEDQLDGAHQWIISP